MTIKETNILKGFGIILMYIHHLFYELETVAKYDINYAPFTVWEVIAFSQMCKVCVTVFVFATAYGTTKSLKNKYPMGKMKASDFSKYSWMRYVKIMSGFWFVWLLAQATSFIGDRYLVYGEDIKLRIQFMVMDFFGSAALIGLPTLNATWWYMTLAILLVFLVPIMWLGVRKVGLVAIVLAIYFPTAAGANIAHYLPAYCFTIVLGILFAEYDWFERFGEWISNSVIRQVMMGALCVVGAFFILILRQIEIGLVIVSLYDGVFAVLIATLSIVVSKLKPIAKVLEILGIHSMNMFLTHTFIKAYYFEKFTYSFRYAWLIVVVLILDTLLLSVLIEWTKKVFRYKKISDVLIDKGNYLIDKLIRC